MTKGIAVLGRACSGMAARSFHTYWQDVAPVPVGPSRKEQERETFEFRKEYAKSKDKLKGARVWRNGEFVIL